MLQPGTRVLLSGGAGFIASHVVDRLIGTGCAVVALDNFITGSQDNVSHLAGHPRFQLIKCDVAESLPDRPELAEPFGAVMHFASPASPVDFERIPLEIMRVGSAGTSNLLDRALADGARFVLASTSEAYGDPLVHPQPETYWGNVNPVGPRSVYDEAKRFAEALTMAYHRRHGVSVGIVRIFNTYGPRMRPDDGRAVPRFISQALCGEPLTVHGTGAQTRSVCYVDDLVSGIVALLESDEIGPVNIGADHEMTMLDLANIIIRLTGSTSRLEFVPRPTDDPERRRPDLRLAADVLGYRPEIDPEVGLARTIEDFRHRLLHKAHPAGPCQATVADPGR